MNTTLLKIHGFYAQTFQEETMTQLSLDKDNNVSSVVNNAKAFNFDSVKKHVYKMQCKAARKQGKQCPPMLKSVDALYMNNMACFVEFKHGYRLHGPSNDRYQENMIGSAKDSLVMHYQFLSGQSVNHSSYDSIFVAVIQAGSDALAVAQAHRASTSTRQLESALLAELKKQLSAYTYNGLYYSKVEVWNAVNFGSRLITNT